MTHLDASTEVRDERKVKRGDRFVAYSDERPKERVYISVTRVARDGSWADVACYTWAVRWTKRVPVEGFGLLSWTRRRNWSWNDLVTQEEDHSRWLREERGIGGGWVHRSGNGTVTVQASAQEPSGHA